MASQEDIERAQDGIAKWNDWARERLANKEAPVVDFSKEEIAGINFEGFIFPGPAIFSYARFNGRAMFSNAVFHADAQMDRVKFIGDANLDKVKFKKSANFDHSVFCKFADFTGGCFQDLSMWGAEFEGEANFAGARFTRAAFTGVSFKHVLTRFTGAAFAHVPSFWATTFATPPLFEGVKIPYVSDPAVNLWRRRMSCAASADDAARFRRLKHLASDWKDHERELEYFGKELRAKRFHETTNRPAILLSWAYEQLSNFGQSVMRPSVALLSVTGLSLALILGTRSPVCDLTWEQIWAALALSLTDWALLLGADKWDVRSLAFDKVYGPGCRFGLVGNLLAYGQSAVSLFLLFLLGLGLRNRFRAGNN
jgi:hypothetical protein